MFVPELPSLASQTRITKLPKGISDHRRLQPDRPPSCNRRTAAAVVGIISASNAITYNPGDSKANAKYRIAANSTKYQYSDLLARPLKFA